MLSGLGQLISTRLFIEDIQPQETEYPTNTTNKTAFDVYREVLLSYRLIFGDAKSRAVAKKHMQYRYDHTPNVVVDPLLQKLCEMDCQHEATYRDIEATDVAQQYSVEHDFPFFGKRLVKIQQFVVQKNPSDWKTLWADRRDLRKTFVQYRGTWCDTAESR